MIHRATLAFAVAATAALTASGSAGAADVAAGRQKAQMCAACHGLDGIAKQPDAATIAGDSNQYLIRQLRAFKTGERKHEQMTIIAQSLSDTDIADLAAWYASLKVTVTTPK